MRSTTPVIFAIFFCVCSNSLAQEHLPAHAALLGPSKDTQENNALMERVIANQKKDDLAQFVYERIERLEIRKNPNGTQPAEVKISRAIPAGTGIDRIPVGADGKPADEVAYRTELEKLERALSWAAEDGRAQREAYDKIARKQKERADLIDATRQAFLYTFITREPLAGRTRAKYHLTPNPAYKPTSRATAIFTKIRGDLWVDEEAGQLARLEVEVTDDISIGGFLAKIYKGSHFVQERLEMAPGVWLPSYAQYDFDGRKFFVSFAIHERTLYSQYRRIGPPKEALQAIRSELGKPVAANIAP